MPNTINYYELLHIQPDAPHALIKTSYKTLMQKLKMHPDLGGDKETAGMLNVAYATLSDPVKRAEYDDAYATKQYATKRRRSQQPAGAASKRAKNRKNRSNTEKRVMWSGEFDRLSSECVFCRTGHQFRNDTPLNALCNTCKCPLAIASKQQLVTTDRRALDRLELTRRIHFRAYYKSRLEPAATKDLSLTGLLFEANADLLPNQLVQISSQFCLSLARIVHRKHESNDNPLQTEQFGVEFLTLCFPNTSGSLLSTRA